MMAEMVASEKKSENTDSDSEGVTGSQNADDNDTGLKYCLYFPSC